MKKLIAAALLIATSTEAGLAQDVEKGANVFKQCQVCHSIGPGAKNKIGPELPKKRRIPIYPSGV